LTTKLDETQCAVVAKLRRTPVLVTSAVLAAALSISGCEAPHGPSTAYTQGPADGGWQKSVPSDAVSFGQWTPAGSGPLNQAEYVFAITAAPALTTYDDGKHVTMTSTVTVRRTQDKGFDEGITDQTFMFSPGTYAPENNQNEDYGESTHVTCQPDRIQVGQTATCTVAFDAVASEIKNSYWNIGSYSVGAWPSQVVR
jgi:hypothetical protein